MTKKERRLLKRQLLELVASSVYQSHEKWEKSEGEKNFFSLVNQVTGIKVDFLFFPLFCVITIPGSGPAEDRIFTYWPLATWALWQVFFPPPQQPELAREHHRLSESHIF